MRLHFACFLLLTLPVSLASAQGAPSGFELALHGPQAAQAGRPMRVRGIAYRVLGLAELRALPGAKIRARASSRPNERWQEVEADGRGFFLLDVPVPKSARGSTELEVSVGDGKGERTFGFPLAVRRPWLLDLITDRVLYEPGETVHVWTRLRDGRSRRPLASEAVHFKPHGGVVKTDESGVAATSFVIPKEQREGNNVLIAKIDGEQRSVSYRVGSRATERLFADVTVTPETARPGEPVTIAVKVAAASGAPVLGAKVEVRLDNEQTAQAVTDPQGLATVTLKAPAYLAHATGVVPIAVSVVHPAYGSYALRAKLGLAVPLTLRIEAVPGGGVLAPEIDGQLYLRIADGAGQPPPVGTVVEVTGAAVPRGSQSAKTDAHGIAVVPTRLPAGAATGVDEVGPYAVTTVKVRVRGPVPRTAVIEVPVRRDVEVMPAVERPVVAPGDSIAVTLRRRASAQRRPVVLELLAEDGLVTAKVLDASVTRAELAVPATRVGVLQIRSRPLVEGGVAEEAGGFAAVLARPAAPTFLELSADREVYDVRSTAQLTLTSNPAAARSWAAVLVRDLAAHSGEQPFARQFLAGAFERAVLDPSTLAASTLLRTALAAHVHDDQPPARVPELLDELGQPNESDGVVDAEPSRGVLRDPFPGADELRRRGMADITRQIEEALSSALNEGRLDQITLGRGTARRFRPTIFEEIGDEMVTSGGEPVTLAMLEAADPSFNFGTVSRRVARARLVKLLVALAAYLDPGEDASPAQLAASREPYGRWLDRMVARGVISAEDLADPWGGHFTLRPSRSPVLVLAVEAVGLELASPGPDGRAGNSDDLRNPFARVVPAGTPYAVSSGEDELMERFSYLAVGANALARIQFAYARISAEEIEASKGEAVRAAKSMGDAFGSFGGLGMSGMGAGGGGSGYGRGIGALGGGRPGARAKPRLMLKESQAQPARPAGIAGLAQIVRERFPPTVMLKASVPLDPKGTTVLPVPLPDAVSTFVVEAIAWSADGWTWSASTRIRVDKTTVVDAPIPPYATVGDALRLPVRVANRSPDEAVVSLALVANDAPPVEQHDVRVPAHDAVEVTMLLGLDQARDGNVMVGVMSAAGEALDAVRRPLVVLPAARRVRREVDALATGTGTLILEVPPEATPRAGAEITVKAGLGVFGASSDHELDAWREAWLGRSRPSNEARQKLSSGGAVLAYALGTTWSDSAVSNSRIASALTRLARELDRGPTLTLQAQILLGLAPAAQRLSARPENGQALADLLRALREGLAKAVAGVVDDPKLYCTAAAALAASAPAGDSLDLPRELVRRARRHEVQVGSDSWIAARGGRHVSTALIAIAEVQLGERERAFTRVRTLARADLDSKVLDVLTRAWARLVAALLTEGVQAKSVRVKIDGRTIELALVDGVGRLPAPSLASPGRHEIEVEAPGANAGLYVRAVSEYGLAWDVPPLNPGPLAVTFEGETGACDERAELVLVAQNRSPRTLGHPVLEIALPAGAELDEGARAEIRTHAALEPDATRGTLRLDLPALPPGGTRRVPLPLRWSVAGRLIGLGVTSFPADQPEAVSITLPQTLDIAAPEVQP